MKKLGNFSVILLCCIGYANEIKLDEIVVSASGFSQDYKDAPASISVINQKNLTYRNFDDIATTIKKTPGVYSNSGVNSNPFNKNTISIRGMEPKYTKFMVDGISNASEDAFGGLGSSGMLGDFLPPIDAVEKIEIIRGPMSSLYGTDAMGGVVNIITKKPKDKANASISSFYNASKNSKYGNLFGNSFYASSPLVQNLVGIELYGKYFSKKEDEIVGANPKNSQKVGGVKFYFWPNDDNEITFSYKYAHSKLARNPGKSGNKAWSKFYDGKDSGKNSVYTITHSLTKENFILDSFLTHNITKTDSDMTGQNINLKNTLFNTKFTYFFDKNILTTGFEYRHQNLKIDPKDKKFSKDKFKRWDFSIFAEDEIHLTDNLNLTFGTRYNEDEDYGKHFSPRGYLVYKFSENFRLKGGVQTGYLTPKPNQRKEGYKNVAASGWGIAIGKSSLKPETSINYEIAAEYIDEKLKASLSLFHIDFKDKIQNKTLCQKGKRGKPNTFGCSYDGKKYLLVYEVANVSKAKISGAELGIDYNILDNTSLNLSYTYTKSEQKSGIEKGEPLNDYPIHMLRVGINSDITKDLNLWADFTYNGKIDNHKLKTQKGSKIITSYEKSHGGYSITDIGLNYKIKDNFTISAAVLNLFDKKFIEEFRNRDVVVYDGTRFQLGFNYSF